MAKFKVNDLIMDGHSTLWVTGVTDTHYEFTEQSFNKFSRPIEAIDANFRLWESKKIWHKPDEEPKRDKEVLVEYKSGFHDAGYYAENEKIFYTGKELVKKDDITRWAYIKDLTQL